MPVNSIRPSGDNRATSPMVDDHPKRRSEVSVRAVGNELVVLDRTANRIHQLNSTARFIWNRCDGQRAVRDIADELAASFEVEPDTASESVTTLVRQFSKLGLLNRPRD